MRLPISSPEKLTFENYKGFPTQQHRYGRFELWIRNILFACLLCRALRVQVGLWWLQTD